MAERTTQKYARPHNNPSEKPFTSTVRASLAAPASETFNDEFILALAQSYENRRAAQAYEWELIRRGGSRQTLA